MGEYLLMPKLDMSMKEGTIVTWLVNVGDDIKKGEYAVEVETGKVSIEVDNTSADGKVLIKYYDEGDTVEVNTPILFIGKTDEKIPTKEESIEYFKTLKRENSSVFEEHGYDYDVIIIGGGQAGYTFAMKAAGFTEKVAIIEENTFGGVCLNRGCIPSRYIRKRAEIMNSVRTADRFGITAGNCVVDYSSVAKGRDELTGRLRQSMKHALRGICDVYEVSAKILSPNIVKAADEIISAKYIIISSGSHAVGKNIPTDGSVNIINTEEVLTMDTLPGCMVFYGKSPYLAEQAQMMGLLGAEVYLISSAVFGGDGYADKRLRKFMQKSGVRFLAGDVQKISDGEIILSSGKSLKADILVCEECRQANIVKSEVDFDMTSDGFYSVDENFRTSVDGIHAIGDANGLSLTAQGAGMDADILSKILFEGEEQETAVYTKCLNTFPRVASFGYTEEELERMGIKYISAKRSLSSHTAAMATGDEGYVKIISDDTFGEILGCSVMAENADDIISVLSLSVRSELTADELAGSVFVHPSISEMIPTVCSEIKERTRRK